MAKYKVLYLINYAPNYRDKFLTELGQFVDLTVTSYKGIEANLQDPDERIGYKYIPLEKKKFLKFHFNTKEFTLGNEDYDVIVVGYSMWFLPRMFNLFRRKKRVICEGLIYGSHKDPITKLLRKIFINANQEGILVYSEMVKKRLIKETKKPIIVFNNTSYSKSEISPLPLPELKDKLHIIWVGRYQERKKIDRLHDLAQRDSRVHVRLIGPGIREEFTNKKKLDNLEIFDAAYEEELKEHFEWAHLVFNPGGAGLLVMNAARFNRSIAIDPNSHHGPEIQLAIDANQDFIDFSEPKKVKAYIDQIYSDPQLLKENAKRLSDKMGNYTIEHMAQQYLKAIKGEWN
ncbi:glycosyltransferase family protein [Brumimicrobium oceani]|uniref:Glycosyl transferase family 1 domain-containing protein n=1 Tax=Brumimicrobium oceani TaxID=2100725 RepID=A0A2U2XF39_9FLAO|nr:glycosyltransferase family 1 protein [Brumimicrobium oceani]PWH86416.1 hypothetical protein DIT68_04030 [Brumimicrobium oceani]